MNDGETRNQDQGDPDQPENLPADDLPDAELPSTSDELPEPRADLRPAERSPEAANPAVSTPPPREQPLPLSEPRPGGPRWVLPLVVMIAIGAIAVVALSKRFLTPDPGELLADAVAQYRNAQALAVSGETVTETSMFGMQQSTTSPIKLAFSKPNRYAMEQGSEMSQSTVICDGTTSWVVMGMFKMVLKSPAPKDLEAMTSGGLMGSMGGQYSAYAPSVLSFATGQVDPAKMQVTSGFDAQDESLAKLPDIKGTIPITVVNEMHVPSVLWIDPHSKLVKRIATQVDGEMLSRQMDDQLRDAKQAGPEQKPGDASSGLGKMEGLMGSVTEMMKSMSTRIVTTYDHQEIDPQLAGSRFSYTPPEGYKVIEADSLDPQAMLGAVMEAATDMLGDLPGFKQLKGEAPADFEAQTLDGRKVKLSSLKGQPVLVEFWDTTCGYSLEMMPILNHLYNGLQDQGLQLVAVSGDDTFDLVTAYAKEHPVDFPIWWVNPDDQKQVTKDYSIMGVPRTILIGKDWKITDDSTGQRSEKLLKASLAKLGLDVTGVKDLEGGPQLTPGRMDPLGGDALGLKMPGAAEAPAKADVPAKPTVD